MKACLITYCTITRENGRQLLNDKYAHLVDQLAPHFEAIFLIGATARRDETFYPNGRSIYTCCVQAQNVQIVETAAGHVRTHPLKKFLVWVKRIPPYFSYIKASDFVYIGMPGFSSILAQMLCRFLRRPYCLYFGTDWEELAPFMANWHGSGRFLLAPYVWLSQRAEKAAVRYSCFTIVHGRKLLEKFSDLGVPVVETIPLVSITPGHFSCRNDTCQRGVINCLYVGSLVPRKAVHELLEALPGLLSRNRQVHLRLVGWGERDYVAMLKRRTVELNLEGHVEFTGHVADLNELLQYYRQADIFVFPSQGEGFPRVIYEAMSQGLPVVTTAIGTIEAVLRDQEQALLVSPGYPELLAGAVERIIVDSRLRRRIIRNGYAFARRKLGQGEAAAQLLRLIQEYGPESGA